MLDALFCEEEREQWDEEVGTDSLEEESERSNDTNNGITTNPPLVMEQDLFWEDEELLSLFSKEPKQTQLCFDPSLSAARMEAVEWMLKVKAHYGFSALTAVLSVNYLDRFLSTIHFQKDKPWMIQLSAVTCLSLAAKVEEIQVPLLLDLQVEDSKYVFEAKTIQRMELLVMSALQWRMNPVTPLSFLDHIVRRLGLKSHIHWEFFRRCEGLILCAVSDSRFVRFPSSVLATATMLHVIHQVEPFNPTEYENQLLSVLKTTKEKVDDCYQLILELSNACLNGQKNPHKRKYEEIPGNPSGVIDASFSCESSNYSEPLSKRLRIKEQQQLRLPSLCRVFVDAVGSPR